MSHLRVAVVMLAMAACEREPTHAPVPRPAPPQPAFRVQPDAALATIAPASTELDDVREVTLRYEFAHNAAGNKHPDVSCISLENEADPSAAFLARFHDPSIEPASACTASAQDGVADKVTHKRGLIFKIEQVEWTRGDSATVKGGYYEGGLSASGDTFTLQRKNGVWTVVAAREDWIS